MIYAQKDLKEEYVDFGFELDENYLQGTTYEDYINGCWIPFNEEQMAFKNEHPKASVKEVIEMNLIPPYEPSIDEIKRRKINDIDRYDHSSNVNTFYYNDEPHWIPVNERIAKSKSLQDEKSLGRTESVIWLDGVGFKMNIDDVSRLLAMVEVYANDCYNVTESHKANVKNLTTIEEIEAYDYTTGYPEKLRL